MSTAVVAVRSLLSAVLVALLLLPAACSNSSSKVAAEVEDVAILASTTRAVADDYVKSQSGQRFELGKDEVTKLVLSYQIKTTYLEHLAKEIGIAVESSASPDDVSSLSLPKPFTATGASPEAFAESLRADQLSKAIAEKLFSNVPIPEPELRKEFEARAPAFETFWRAKAKMAYFASTPNGDLRDRVQLGEAFEQAAASLGAEKLGPIEITPITDLPPQVIDAVAELRSGKVSDLIAAGQGGVVVLVEDFQPLGKLSFEAARQDLTTALSGEHLEKLFLDWFDEKLKKAHVQVSDEFGRWRADTASVE